MACQTRRYTRSTGGSTYAVTEGALEVNLLDEQACNGDLDLRSAHADLNMRPARRESADSPVQEVRRWCGVSGLLWT